MIIQKDNPKFFKKEFPSVKITTICLDVKEEMGKRSLNGKQSSMDKTAREIQLEKSRFDLLYWLSFEKLMEIMLVHIMAVFALKWDPLFSLLKDNFCHLFGLIFLSALLMYVLQRCTSLHQVPGILLLKLTNLIFLTAVCLFFAIHLPVLSRHRLCSYFLPVVSGTAGLSYALFMLISSTKKVNVKGWGLWIFGMVMPIVVFTVMQLMYFHGWIGKSCNLDHFDFTKDVTIGVVFSAVLSYDVLSAYQMLISSPKLEELLIKAGLLPEPVFTIGSKQSHDDNMDDVEKGGISKF